MFTRATSRSYTCLKCQYRLTLRESARIESQNITTRAPRRWQTSAASAAVEDEYEKDASGDPQRDPAESQESRSFYNRRWRPTTTVNIGADVLGKPAEILLLPASKRRRNKTLRDVDEGPEEDVVRQEVSEEKKDKPQLRIHEALAQESKPTMRRDVLQNIEKIREEAKNNAMDGSLPQEKWLECFRGLSRGFTKRQLGWYLEENVSVLSSTSPKEGVRTRPLDRSQAATDILSKIWGYADNVPKDLSSPFSGSVNLGRGRRELILGVDREWRRFLQHVSIEPSSNPGWIDIAGPELWVTKAQAVFGSLKKRVCSQHLVLPTIYAKALEEQESSAGLGARLKLQELIQKYEITMTKRSAWTAHSFYVERLANFERELILAQPKLSAEFKDATASLILSSHSVGVESVMPVYNSTLVSHPPEWYRYSLIKVPSNDVATHRIMDPEGQAFQSLIKNLKSQIYDKDVSTLNYSFLRESSSMIGSVTAEFSAAIGQVLHKSQGPHNIAADDLELETNTRRNDFVPTIPLLRQFLAKQEVYYSSKDSVNVSDPPLVLRFIPSDPRFYPTIELRATVTASSTTAIEMTIESVKLIFSFDSAYIALPTTPNDLRLTRLASVPIFQSGGPVQKTYAPLLGQLASQIRLQDKITEDPSRLHLNKLLDLDLRCLETATKGKRTTKRKKSSISAVRYALANAELLDKRFYRVPGQDKILLEHTSYLPLKVSSEQGTEEFLEVIPMGEASTLANGEQFVDFVKSAVSVVEILDEFVTEKTREMIHEKEEQVQVQGEEKKDE